MAQRRMFSRSIISSGAFIKMPPSSQSLYFHLAINADDDGVVEAFPVMRMISASEDDLKILVAKKFITILNDDLVTFVNDWLEHNLIRKDRKIDSKYKHLLVNVSQEIKLINNKDDKKQQLTLFNDNQMTTKCQPNDNQMSAQVRIGKVSINKNICSSDDERLKNFEDFWKKYPRKQAKQDAKKAWKQKKACKSKKEIFEDIDYRLSHNSPNGWLENGRLCNLSYIPLPASYLRGERWEDEEVGVNTH